MASQFIAEGLHQGERGVVAIFEELPADYTGRAAKFGLDLETPQKEGTLKVIYIRPLDLSVDETVYEVMNAVKQIDAKRVVVDSLVGFEMALAPGFRHEFRESLYRMIGALTRLGVTVVSTVEVEENFTSMSLSNFTISFLADDILRLRYVWINGQRRCAAARTALICGSTRSQRKAWSSASRSGATVASPAAFPGHGRWSWGEIIPSCEKTGPGITFEIERRVQ